MTFTHRENHSHAHLAFASDIPQPLTREEEAEFATLKLKLFGGDMFVIFTDEELASTDHRRYDELINKKMRHIRFILR